MISESMSRYRYLWPESDLGAAQHWTVSADGRYFERSMPEDLQELAVDSRWPAFFPSSVCLVTARHGSKVALERAVGASIVNRFPYVLALTFCRQHLSKRHCPRNVFCETIESGGSVAAQFFPPGPSLDQALGAIGSLPEQDTHRRVDHSGLSVRRGATNEAPLFDDAYMVYEGTLIGPGRDYEGFSTFPVPWVDVGSHRVYFVEINAIQLREEIAREESQILWRSLPAWEPRAEEQGYLPNVDGAVDKDGYTKGYTPHYRFPSAATAAFESDAIESGMAIKYFSPLPEDQVEVDNDRARWPCFFPSSLSLLTSWAEDGVPNMMPCGSTMVVSRHPMIFAVCLAYAAINVRYSPRATLGIIRRTGAFGCGVPFIHETLLDAIQYTGNISFSEDPEKLRHARLESEARPSAPALPALPIHFECSVVGEIRLGTHSMVLGEVRQVRVRRDVTPSNPLEWYPLADLTR